MKNLIDKAKEMGELMEEVRPLVAELTWDGCLKLYDELDSRNPIFGLLFDRMEQIDGERFRKWLRLV